MAANRFRNTRGRFATPGTFDPYWHALLTVEEAAARMSVKVRTIQQWMRSGHVLYVLAPSGDPRIVVESLTKPLPAATWREGLIAVPASVQRFCDHYERDNRTDAMRHRIDVEDARAILMHFLEFL